PPLFVLLPFAMSNRENEMKTCQARVWLGFPRQKGDKTRSGNSRYTLWRSEIAGFMQMHDIQNSTQAGTAKWQMVKDFAIGHRLTRGYEQAYHGSPGRLLGQDFVLFAPAGPKPVAPEC